MNGLFQNHNLSLVYVFGVCINLAVHFTCIIITYLLCVRTASSDHTARLWHVDRSDPIREYQGHTKAVTALAYNDSRY